MPSLRDPETLHPLLLPLHYRAMDLWRAGGLIPVLTFAWRSAAAQDRLWQIGRRGIPGEKIVTYVRGGYSWHNVERDGRPASLAFDVAMMTDDGHALLPDTDERWIVAGQVGEGLGLTWGGRWRLRDCCHYQLDNRGTLALADAMAGVDPAGGVA